MMQHRVEYDLNYIDRWSLWLDVRILARTLLQILRPRNVY
jgi:lipopolysaccharide/colanic/teichoic acid biosynthesis glycosyltransferase